MISYRQLFKHATPWQKIQFYSGSVCALLAGMSIPFYAVVVGLMFEILNPNVDAEVKQAKVVLAVKLSATVAFLQFVLSWWSYAMLQISAERLAFTLRAKYLDSLMRQETEFFESQKIEALPAKISEYFAELPSATGDKYNGILTFLGMMISGFALAFIAAPNLALLLLLYFPVFVAVVARYGKYSKGQTALKLKQNAELGGYTEEILSALKLVVSFGREEHSLSNYNVLAETTK